MKKMFLTIVAAGAFMFTTQSATAQVTGLENQNPQAQEAQQKHDFQKIEAQEVPAEVKQALERDYQGATISEAYAKEKNGEKKYKLVISTNDGQSKELFADAQGNWIDKSKKKAEKQIQE